MGPLYLFCLIRTVAHTHNEWCQHVAHTLLHSGLRTKVFVLSSPMVAARQAVVHNGNALCIMTLQPKFLKTKSKYYANFQTWCRAPTPPAWVFGVGVSVATWLHLPYFVNPTCFMLRLPAHLSPNGICTTRTTPSVTWVTQTHMPMITKQPP